jgi:glutamine amidotransferase-like uncharacterized protein
MKTIAVFLHHPECSEDCVDAMVHALSDNYIIKTFSEEDIEDVNFFNGLDVIAFPGGIGDSSKMYTFFTRRTGNRVAKFIEDGGHYLGICMGAYWADQWYFDLIDDVRAEQYIKRPNADIKRSYGTVASVTWNGQPEKMYFYDGCALVGDESTFKTVARYANGDPMAIIKGRVGIIGCHPEAPLYWYKKPWAYINKHWNGGKHHTLFLNFVNELTENYK